MKVIDRPNPNELVFEMSGVDVSFANALRRILLSDIPTVAIEHVYMQLVGVVVETHKRMTCVHYLRYVVRPSTMQYNDVRCG